MENIITKPQKTSKAKILFITQVAIFTALAVVLSKFEIPIFGYIKFDPSLIPSVIAGALLGPVGGIIVELLKNLIDLPTSSTLGFGQLINFLVASSVIIPFSLIYRRNFSIPSYIIGIVVSMVSIMTIGALCNYILTEPFYIAMGWTVLAEEALIQTVIASVGFNATKCFISLLPVHAVTMALRKAKLAI